MTAAFNGSWVDNNGGGFTAASDITDDMWGSQRDIDNDDVIDAIAHGHPVFFGNTHHAMVLIQASYLPTQGEPTIVTGTVWDPEPPSQGGGIHQIAGEDLKAKFAAIPVISNDDDSPAPAPAHITHQGGTDIVCDDCGGTIPQRFASLCEALNAVIPSSPSDFAKFRTGTIHAGLVEDTNLEIPDATCKVIHFATRIRLECSFPKSSFKSILNDLNSCLDVKAGYTRTFDSFSALRDNSSLPTIEVYKNKDETTVDITKPR
jgi:hypothetical protein